jgi:hypothetical protein
MKCVNHRFAALQAYQLEFRGCTHKEFKVSLIKCPDCGKDVSTRDASCPHCGRRLAAEEIQVATELAAKRYKLYLVLSVLVCGLGWILLFSGDESSAHTGHYFIVIGLTGYIVTKFLIWWLHD